MAATGPLLILIGQLAWGLEADFGFFGGSAAVALMGAYLVSQNKLWMRIAGIVAGLLVLGSLFWTMFGLGVPTSFFDFVPGLLVTPGVILAITASVGGIVTRRRGIPASTGGERRAIAGIAAAIAALAVLSAILTIAGQETVNSAGADTTVTASDFDFSPAELTVGSGETVLVRNNDPFLHTFTVDGLNIDVELKPGTEELITVEGAAQAYTLYCRPHTSDNENPGEDDMAGTLTIE